jgi:sugar lactone lactonase YvrE
MRPHSFILAGAIWLGTTLALAHPPTVGPAAPFAGGIAGPEGLAFGKDGTLFVGTADGDILRVASDGTTSLLASTGDRLAGVSVMRDGTILACGFNMNRVWAIDPVSAAASVYANVSSPNFVVQTKRGHVIVSSSFTGSLVDITNGANVILASGLSFPNGLAVRKRQLYVAETFANRVSRLPFATPGSLGAPEIYATGLPFADGIAFDRPGQPLRRRLRPALHGRRDHAGGDRGARRPVVRLAVEHSLRADDALREGRHVPRRLRPDARRRHDDREGADEPSGRAAHPVSRGVSRGAGRAPRRARRL